MVKPVYLYDTNTYEMLDVKADRQSVTIGRSVDMDFPTFSGYKGVSRHQADVQYFPHGKLLLIHRSNRVSSFCGPSLDELEEVHDSSEMLPGYFIRFGDEYALRILRHSHDIVRERLDLRSDETQIIRHEDIT
tara:strand:- start:794 stop:1192 length:399 start_codon:yes stop_codon:yes gene_type:complete